MYMKRTVKPCCNCQRMFVVYNNIINGLFCKICRIKKQKETEIKLSEYMQMKYNKKIIGVN